MAQQFEVAQTILQQAPELQDDDLLRHYARQACLHTAKPFLNSTTFPVLMLCERIPATICIRQRLLCP